jgi:hypothetical protein
MPCKSNNLLIIIICLLAASTSAASITSSRRKFDLKSSRVGTRIRSLLGRFNIGSFEGEIGNSLPKFREINDAVFGVEPSKDAVYNSNDGVYAVLPKFRPDKLISFTHYLLLCACSIYITFFSARHNRTTIIVFCFLNSYFLLTFTIVQLDAYKTNVLEYQFVLFCVGLIFGFALTVLTHIYRTAELLMVGFGFVTTIAVMCAQFVVDFNSNLEWGLFVAAYALFGSLISCAYKFCNKDLAIIVGAFYGATVYLIYTGVLTNHIVSFEDEVEYLPRKVANLELYFGLIACTAILGLLVQYLMFICSRRKLKDDSMDDFSESSFWV